MTRFRVPVLLIKTELDAKPSGEIDPPWSTTLEVFMGKHLHLGKELKDGQRHFRKRLARRLGNDFFYHISSDVGEPVVSTLMSKREFFVIESEKLKYCGVEVMHVNRVVRN
tara:strand:+ start:161 stop:493 length:333 start_codon:yes stop_codon:yes gene_type:complete